jgi:hypothetical protein
VCVDSIVIECLSWNEVCDYVCGDADSKGESGTSEGSQRVGTSDGRLKLSGNLKVDSESTHPRGLRTQNGEGGESSSHHSRAVSGEQGVETGRKESRVKLKRLGLGVKQPEPMTNLKSDSKPLSSSVSDNPTKQDLAQRGSGASGDTTLTDSKSRPLWLWGAHSCFTNT